MRGAMQDGGDTRCSSSAAGRAFSRGRYGETTCISDSSEGEGADVPDNANDGDLERNTTDEGETGLECNWISGVKGSMPAGGNVRGQGALVSTETTAIGDDQDHRG